MAEQLIFSSTGQAMLLQLNPFRKVKESLEEVRPWGTNAEGQSSLCWGKHREGNPGKRCLKEDLHGALLKEKMVTKVFLHSMLLFWPKEKGLGCFGKCQIVEEESHFFGFQLFST